MMSQYKHYFKRETILKIESSNTKNNINKSNLHNFILLPKFVDS